MITNDSWTGPDKRKHFIGGAAIALIVGLLSGWALIGFAAGCAVGAAKEAYDKISKKGTSSLQDLVVTCLGSGVGAGVAHILIANSVLA